MEMIEQIDCVDNDDFFGFFEALWLLTWIILFWLVCFHVFILKTKQIFVVVFPFI